MTQCLPEVLTFEESSDDFVLGSSSEVCSIIIDGDDEEAIHIAARTFASDVGKVIGTRPEIQYGTQDAKTAIIACTVDSELAKSTLALADQRHRVQGKWESFHIQVVPEPMPGVGEALVILGSDKRGVIYGLYTLSNQMGVSPWYWWSDVPVNPRERIGFPRSAILGHGEPTVRYRGFFINDEQPVLWNWAKEHFKTGQGPPFQTELYEKLFELCLRLRGNYMWPAMWCSMFSVDGLDISNGLPLDSGPNQDLAERMGIVMGTSHHEPMAKNQKEFTDFGTGEWNYSSNKGFLDEFWRHGAGRARGKETVFTVGMRGDGDLPLDGANVELTAIQLLERIVSTQQDILRTTYPEQKLGEIPQMWAMYKEVMAYYANGLSVPPEVTSLLADDNWGNLMAVLPDDRRSPGGGGVYYHADYVGDPRSYKWLSTVSLAKMWEQLHAAHHFETDNIWIINIGDLKFLEIPLEFFMNLAYDIEQFEADSLPVFLRDWSCRQFGDGAELSSKIGDVIARYSMYASRCKAELLDESTYSLIHQNEWARVLEDWENLERNAEAIYQVLDEKRKFAFEGLVLVSIRLQTNLNRMYSSVAKANLYATQSRSSTNVYAKAAIKYFEQDTAISEAFHEVQGGKWRHMLSQPHIGYQYWQAPLRDSMPSVPWVASPQRSIGNAWSIHTRFSVEGQLGAWPGDNKHNSALGYGAPDPVLRPVDRYSRPRWVEVFAAGCQDTTFNTEADSDWLQVSPSCGSIAKDGSTDTSVLISINWEKLSSRSDAPTIGHVRFTASDGSTINITVPVNSHSLRPPNSFRGSVEVDSCVAIEAEHYATLVSPSIYQWQKIPAYGRSLSGMAVYPLSYHRLEKEHQPGLQYAFWLGQPLEGELLNVTLYLGPTLNYILGKPFLWRVQLDNLDPVEIQPVPSTEPGSLPDDWEGVVAQECRKVEIKLPTAGWQEGAHTITIWAVSTGLVLQRVVIHREALDSSYLGPIESMRLT